MTAKLLGLLLIAAGAGGSACLFLCLCRSQLRSLRCLRQMLELIQGELNTSALPLAQLLEAISPHLSDSALHFADLVREGMEDLGRRSFTEIWADSLSICFPDLARRWRHFPEGKNTDYPKRCVSGKRISVLQRKKAESGQSQGVTVSSWRMCP